LGFGARSFAPRPRCITPPHHRHRYRHYRRSFENMLRILKRYDLPQAGSGGGVPVPGRHVALSGSPGLLSYSSDDFYVLSSGLVTIETTIDVRVADDAVGAFAAVCRVHVTRPPRPP
jgi:hypothetical protein